MLEIITRTRIHIHTHMQEKKERKVFCKINMRNAATHRFILHSHIIMGRDIEEIDINEYTQLLFWA